MWSTNFVMQAFPRSKLFRAEQKFRNLAIIGLIIVTLTAVFGPSGLLAWSEHLRLRDDRSEQLASIEKERDALRHRVELLDHAKADPDLVSELIRKNLDVVHPDEIVVSLDHSNE